MLSAHRSLPALALVALPALALAAPPAHQHAPSGGHHGSAPASGTHHTGGGTPPVVHSAPAVVPQHQMPRVAPTWNAPARTAQSWNTPSWNTPSWNTPSRTGTVGQQSAPSWRGGSSAPTVRSTPSIASVKPASGSSLVQSAVTGGMQQTALVGRSSSPYSTNRSSGFAFGFGGFGGFGGPAYGFDGSPFGVGAGSVYAARGAGILGGAFGDINLFGGRGFGTPPPPDAQLVKSFVATLTIQFPPTSQMWMGGQAVDIAEEDEHVLTSPPLGPGEEYTFNVKLRWSRDGKTYETNRAVTLAAGARSRLVIVSGEEVKD
jgi:hypothetical protein